MSRSKSRNTDRDKTPKAETKPVEDDRLTVEDVQAVEDSILLADTLDPAKQQEEENWREYLLKQEIEKDA